MFHKEAIVLHIYAPTCPNLSLIDLPGITKRTKDDAGKEYEVEEYLKEITLHYTKDDRTIILAVNAAN